MLYELSSFFPRKFLQSTASPHQSTKMTLERAASHNKVTHPPCLFWLPTLENVLLFNNSNKQYVSDVIINYS